MKIHYDKTTMKGATMKFVFSIALAAVFMLSHASAEAQVTFKSEEEKLSYSMGYDLGKKLQEESIEIVPDVLSRGIRDGFAGKDPLMNADEIKESLRAFQQMLIAKETERKKRIAEKNRKEGEAFLAENRNKEGVTTLPSGLQYRVVEEGKGKQPALTDTVSTHYRGTLIDGTEFDSSYSRGKPAVFPVQGVIRGWTEALQLMKEGAKWQLFIPAKLAYGERGIGNQIGPNSTLIFDIELLTVQEKQ
jgi:FKBP-type peptidyl-prolyl cis-trans isomerase FklB